MIDREDLPDQDSGDLIAGERIAQLESIAEISADYEVFSERSSVEEDNDLLRALKRNGRNLVLDSVYSHLAPHIVPTQTWRSPSSTHVSQSKAHTRYKVVSPAKANYNVGMNTNDWPLRVFSHEEFAESVQMATEETIMSLELVVAVQRHQAKANAFHASKTAPWFRRRYDSPSFVSSVERPFKWIDPAESLLLTFRRCHGTTIIDSVTPFTVPHIVISEPAPQIPWIPISNYPTDPQDCQWGARLTVPAKFINIVNPPSEAAESDSDSDFSDEERHVNFIEYVSSGGLSSRPETTEPATPLAAQDQCKSFFVDGPVHDEGREFASFLDASPNRTDEALAVPSCDEMLPIDYGALGDDEDDLPPFDDWYTGIQ